MRVERVIECADQKYAGVGKSGRHENETSGWNDDYNPRSALCSALDREHRLLVAELQIVEPPIEPAGAE